MAKTQSQDSLHHQLVSIRESVESLWIAIIMAFVLRAFVIEAFVIPTGSMAPRLMGQHWQFDCPACGYHYAFGLLTRNGDSVNADLSKPVGSGANYNIGGPPAVCPNCGYKDYFGLEHAYSGDRVLVLKYLYRFVAPTPWDVVVFKDPQDLRQDQNFIKRLIGLPGEMIQIVHGDVYYRQLDADLDGDGVIDGRDFADPRSNEPAPWKILRKPARTQEAMWQVIFENDYQPDATLYEKAKTGPWKEPWQTSPHSTQWDLSANNHRVFKFAGSPVIQNLQFDAEKKRFGLNYAYNGGTHPEDEGTICSDLKLSFMFVPQAADARIGLHLSSYKHHFRATVSADGQCVLEHGSADGNAVKWDPQPWGSETLEPLKIGTGCDIALVHVDHMVQLWVDGKVRIQTTDSQYPANMQQAIEEEAHGVPVPVVEIFASGGPCELWHVDLMRDVYYTQVRLADIPSGPPMGWATNGNPIILRKYLNNPDMDEFFVLGDNSPVSKDSRMWSYHSPLLRPGYQDGTVPRYSMIGRAFFVYWPGGFRLPLLEKLPLVPNVGRMRFIR